MTPTSREAAAIHSTTPSGGAEEADSSSFDHPLHGRVFTALGVALVCLPMVVALVALAGTRWFPTGDMAQAELHMRGFWSHPPLLGAAGRIGTLTQQGSHPGPSLWWAMMPVYTILGRTSWALEAAVVSVNIASVAGIVAVARRRGGPALMALALALVAVLVRASGFGVLTEPWNPWLAVLPFLLFTLLVWSLVCGDRWALPWAVATGVHCVQCHVGYLPLVLALLAWGIVGLGLRTRGPGVPGGLRSLIRPAAAAIGVGSVLWLPPVIEQLTAKPGNLRVLWDYFRTPVEQPIGVTGAFRALAGELNLFGGWVMGRRHLPTQPPNWAGFGLIVALWSTAAWVAFRRRREGGRPDGGDLWRLHLLCGVLVTVGFAAMTRIFGTFFDYVIRWMWVVTAMVVLTSVATLILPLFRTGGPSDRHGAPRPGSRRLQRVAAGPAALTWTASLAVTLAVSLVGTVQFASATNNGERNSTVVGQLAARLDGRLDPQRTYLVRWRDNVALGAVGFGTVLELERRGFTVRTEPQYQAGVLPFRVIEPWEADHILTVAVGPFIDSTAAEPGETLIARVDPRSPTEQAAAERLRRRAVTELEGAGMTDLAAKLDTSLMTVLLTDGIPAGARDAVSGLISLGEPVGVFVSEPPPRPR